MMSRSCGDCVHFCLGECDAPLPQWCYRDRVILDFARDSIVATDGSEEDLADRCDLYKEEQENE